MENFSGTFYKPEPDESSDFRKNCAFNYGTFVKYQILCFFWMQNRHNIGVCIVRTISKTLL